MTREVRNVQVKRAGARFIGHSNSLSIELLLETFCINLQVSKLHGVLTEVFGVDPEDGYWVEDLKGKYCRVHIEDSKIIALQHITEGCCLILKDK